MLKTIDLIKDVEEKYVPMLKMIKIPEFMKCIAQFSGLEMNDISDETIKGYLLTWAENKYKYFKMLGDKLQLDIPFKYHSQKDEKENDLKELKKAFPAYCHWVEEFQDQKTNKICGYDLSYSTRNRIREYFPQLSIDGTTITHFFKKFLQAPDELITRIGQLYENQEVEAIYTISIDPVDFMTSSDNPYNWTSCYRLELGRDDSHADGCLAATLDTASLVAYVWNNHGKFKLYDKYELKDIRYKRMRMTFALSEDMKCVHFNAIYPGRSNYERDFQKQIRGVAEKVIAEYIGVEDKWVKAEHCDTHRQFPYGYNEYDNDNMWKIKDTDDQVITVFNTILKSPDGCGLLPGTDWSNVNESVEGWGSDEEVRYNGDGFIASNFYDEYYCEYSEDYCDCGGNCDDCMDCPYWRDAHPICSLTTDPELEDLFGGEDECLREDGNPDVDDGIADACQCDCKNCPKWQEHKEWLKANNPELYEERFGEEEEEKKEPETTTINLSNDTPSKLIINTANSDLTELWTQYATTTPIVSFNTTAQIEPIAWHCDDNISTIASDSDLYRRIVTGDTGIADAGE